MEKDDVFSILTIKEGTEVIDKDAYADHTELKEANLPDSIIEMGASSFLRCTNLEKIKLPKHLKKIGTYCFFDCNHLSEITWPEDLETIESRAFRNCSSLKKIVLPDTITEIQYGAFEKCKNLESITLSKNCKKIGISCFAGCNNLSEIIWPEDLEIIDECAFEDCSSLKKIVFPNNLTEIKWFAFNDCDNLQEVVIPASVKEISNNAFNNCYTLKSIKFEYEKGKYYQLNRNVLNATGLSESEITALKNFLQMRDKLKKTFIPAKPIYANTPKELIKNFYDYSKLWAEVLNDYAKFVNKKSEEILYEVKADFYKVCLISGLFSNDYHERMRAKDFIQTKIIGKFSEVGLHERFSGLNTIENGYDPDFAKFLIKNFGPYFLILDDYEFEIHRNLISKAYNNFSEIKKAYPNKVISTNTINDRLTEKDVYSFVLTKTYDSIKTKEEEKLAEYCSRYGYTQNQFNSLKLWMNEGIKIREEGKENLFCKEDSVKSQNKITYRFLEKGDPLGAILGEITNCCQSINNVGESCCKHGLSNPNGGFVVFELNNKIIGQSWVWYDERSKKICLDNIEIPRSAKYNATKTESDFIGCLKRLSEGFKTEMANKGKEVSIVSMGKGYNDILEVALGSFNEVSPKEVLATAVLQSGETPIRLIGNAPSGVYTDVNQGELILE